MELWGGIECTLNRIGDRRLDQLAKAGHYTRADDLDAIAALGIRTLRYPLLWERAATRHAGHFDWRFADERLPHLQRLGITPIAGLVHHGCGPETVELTSDSFATGLAEYAGQLAARFPWLEWYTPVNEPVTTARFSGLYGHWYPHARNDRAFARIVINECRATVLAMRAIRTVNSKAKLVQTDDLGTIYSTRRMSCQADFENHRRWLGWDLLCGHVDREHALYAYLISAGIDAAELGWFEENSCPPDIIGIDHYVTSDRYLDENVSNYPLHARGGNGREMYADVDAVRVLEQPGTSLRRIVLEASFRYRRPLALTEVHIGCTEHEQIRWLHNAHHACVQLEAFGVDIRAITAWALLGSYDWDSLLTHDRGHYESGAFCLRSGRRRRTAVGDYLAALCGGHDVMEDLGQTRANGWWQQPERLLYGQHRRYIEPAAKTG